MAAPKPTRTQRKALDDADGPFIVVLGDPVGGFTFTGPFESYEAAERWAADRQDSWTTWLEPPNT